MTVQFATAVGVAAVLGGYLSLLFYLAARRRRLRIAAVRHALIRQKRRLAVAPAKADAAGVI